MIYCILADGFEEIEALTPIDILRRAGVSVTSVGVTGKTVTGSHGISVEADITESEAADALSRADIEAVVLPGGMPGADNLNASSVVEKYISAAKDCGAFIAAICAAPSILGHKGLLEGKKAVCYPGFEQELKGAQVLDEAVCVDGSIITSCGMGSAIKFSHAIIEKLFDKARADRLIRTLNVK